LYRVSFYNYSSYPFVFGHLDDIPILAALPLNHAALARSHPALPLSHAALALNHPALPLNHAALALNRATLVQGNSLNIDWQTDGGTGCRALITVLQSIGNHLPLFFPNNEY
jgi:hypothetical protein